MRPLQEEYREVRGGTQREKRESEKAIEEVEKERTRAQRTESIKAHISIDKSQTKPSDAPLAVPLPPTSTKLDHSKASPTNGTLANAVRSYIHSWYCI